MLHQPVDQAGMQRGGCAQQRGGKETEYFVHGLTFFKSIGGRMQTRPAQEPGRLHTSSAADDDGSGLQSPSSAASTAVAGGACPPASEGRTSAAGGTDSAVTCR